MLQASFFIFWIGRSSVGDVVVRLGAGGGREFMVVESSFFCEIVMEEIIVWSLARSLRSLLQFSYSPTLFSDCRFQFLYVF